MRFTETELPGAFVIDLEKREDERGFFARAWCAQEFMAHGIHHQPVQANLAMSKRRGTLRGLHYQLPPHAEAKLVRCIKGAMFDVIIDLRSDSPAYKQWFGVELSADNHRMLYVPEGFAHGYQALLDDTEVFYQVSQFYTPGAERGIRYNDPAFGVVWPIPVQVVSEKDTAWPDYSA